jgi:hypothetical protein
LGSIPRPLGRNTGGAGDLFPRKHINFKGKSLIPSWFTAGILYYILSMTCIFCQYVQQILGGMAHSTLAVNEVFASPIKQTVGLRAGWNVP